MFVSKKATLNQEKNPAKARTQNSLRLPFFVGKMFHQLNQSFHTA